MQDSSRRNHKLYKGNAPVDSSRSTREGAVMGVGKFDVLALLESEAEGVEKCVVQQSVVDGTNGGDGEVVGKVGVASLVEVIPSQVTLNPKDHVAVRALEREADNSCSHGVDRRSNPNVGIALPKGTQRVMSSPLHKRKPTFKYLAAWQSHSGFEGMLTDAWKKGVSIIGSYYQLQEINNKGFPSVAERNTDRAKDVRLGADFRGGGAVHTANSGAADSGSGKITVH
ncbi:hypothetical protein V6N11_076409 [Hibiscus sabdariffa]|uniref:Uncharacterized protein n=1 Tax=Hibiscus sabdariffa TaxID=183260 RepID=A0ABR2Q677_9ROSI